MKRITPLFLLLISLAVTNLVRAQTIEDGRKMMYYEKYISAKNLFQQLVKANPADENAAYWLGQAMIAPKEDKDISGAKDVYRKALEANSNSALLIAGMGHIELLEGKTQDARSRFETAINLSGKKNVQIYNAVGFANGDFDSKLGDAAYAVYVLKLATEIKGMKDPDVWANLGDAYRKFADGGNAQKAYEAALAIKPDYARAMFRIGRIYQTQGLSQEDIYLRFYNQAITTDPNYTPVYYVLYQYYYESDVSRSSGYLDKYLAAKGIDEPNACFMQAQMLYARGIFQQTINKADECIAASGASPYPNLFGLKAYSYYRLGDSLNAKSSFDLYFQKQKPEKIGIGDYKTFAEILLKIPGNETLAGTITEKAVALDSTENGKVMLLKSMALNLEVQKKYKEAAVWYSKVLLIKKDVSKTDIYYAGYNYYRSGHYQQSGSIFKQYTLKFPDDIFGYYMMGKSYWYIDTNMVYGLANYSFKKAVEVGDAYPDKSKILSQLIGSYKYLIAYHANISKNKEASLAFIDKVLLLDSTEQETISNREVIANLKISPAQVKEPIISVNEKGDVATINPVGSISTVSANGDISIVEKEGRIITIRDGVTTIIEKKK